MLIAQNFSKHDKHAINRIGGNVELKDVKSSRVIPDLFI